MDFTNALRCWPALLPVLTFVFLFLFVQLKERDWRQSWLIATLIMGVLATFFTEILSLLHAITFAGMFFFWSLSCAAALVAFLVRRRKSSPVPSSGIRGLFGIQWQIFVIVLIILYLGLIGVLAYTNTPDALIYHLPRVMHWIQNRNVENYPTSILRQLMLAPGSGYCMLQFQILSGVDRFANSIQWLSMIGCVIGVSVIARSLHADLNGQIFAATLCATLPMGILQASNAANHYVVTLWITLCVVFLFEFARSPSIRSSVFIGICLGLAILAKETAYIFLFPLALWWMLEILRKPASRKLSFVLVPPLIALLLNAGVYLRHLQLYGGVIVPAGQNTYQNQVFSLSAILSNILRNIAVHLSAPVESWNLALQKAFVFIHNHILLIDINDPRTTWSRFAVKELQISDAVSGNLLHLFLIAIAVVIFFSRKIERERTRRLYFASLVTAGLIFCVYLQWMPWHSRLHLPLFVLFIPFVAVILSRVLAPRLVPVMSILLFISCIPWLFMNVDRPISGPTSVFKAQPGYKSFYTDRMYRIIEASEYAGTLDCNEIGLDLFQQEAEYLYWAHLKKNKGNAIRLEHVEVRNISQRYSNQSPFKDFRPCVVLSRRNPQGPVLVRYQGKSRRFF